MPVTASDGLQVSYATPVPTRGLLEGIDPAALNYPGDEYSPDIENCRFSSDTWQTRLGSVLWKVIPGSGPVRFLENLYQSSGAITRLAAQGSGVGAQLYELREGTDVAFQAASGGAGLGGTAQPLFQGVAHQDVMYFTDRAGALRKYRPVSFTPANLHTIPVAQPAAPAAPPTGTPRPYFAHALDWGSWIDSNAGTFSDADDTTNNPPPSPGSQTRLLSILSTAAKGETITWPTGVSNINSHTLAFYLRQTPLKAPSSAMQFDFGLGSPTDYGIKLRDVSQIDDEWYPIFLDIADITSANYLRFRVIVSKSVTQYRVSNIFFPGRLEGQYLWRYTHYDSVNNRESAPSTPINNGQPLDFSAIGKSWDPNTAKAFSKSCALSFTSDSGVDASTDKMRVYRSGGVPSLTVDENGNDLWLRVAEIPDFHTTFSANDAAGSSALDLASTAGLVTGMYLVLEPGVVGKEEYVQVTGVAPAFVNISLGGGALGLTQYSHAIGAVVRIAFIDNVANEQIDLTTPIDVARNDPPTGIQWIAKAGDGRLWVTVGSKVYVSNKPTPDRPNDFEVFPLGVDPLTTRSLTQGWTFELQGGISADETIQWFGFYNGFPTALTRRGMYVIQASSQSEWGPIAVQRIHNTGCIAGDTVAECNGFLYWVSDGPRVMRWNGSGEPENISDLKINLRLKAAPQTLWNQWYARAHTTIDGHYYKLWIVPSGQTTPTMRLDYNIERQAWEPVVYRDSGGNPIGFSAAVVRAGNVDSPDLYAADGAGNVVQTEVGNLDSGVPITVRLATQKIPLVQSHPYWTRFLYNSLVHHLLIRLSSVSDMATVQLQTGGSEYLSTTQSYTIDLSGSGDKEIKVRAHRTLVGRWLQITITGSFSNRPAFRDLTFFYVPWRSGKISANHP